MFYLLHDDQNVCIYTYTHRCTPHINGGIEMRSTINDTHSDGILHTGWFSDRWTSDGRWKEMADGAANQCALS